MALTLQYKVMAYSIAQIVSATLSFFGSATILFMIFRSHQKLSTPFHRLLLGLSISDMISSFSMAFASVLSPDGHWGWKSIGNMTLCRAQGYLFVLGCLASPMYNCSLCIYYLFELKFTNWRESLEKIEIALHVVPILVAFTWSTTMLALNEIVPDVTTCYVNDDGLYLILHSIFQFVIVPIIIIGSMILLYREVAEQDNRNSQYGYSFHSNRSAPRNTVAARRRLLAYSSAYFLTWTCYFIILITRLFTGPDIPFGLGLAHFILYPLQGFFNFIVYIYPRVLKHWNRHEREGTARNSRFFLAFRDSVMSRGMNTRSGSVARQRGARRNSTIRNPQTRNSIGTKENFVARHSLVRIHAPPKIATKPDEADQQRPFTSIKIDAETAQGINLELLKPHDTTTKEDSATDNLSSSLRHDRIHRMSDLTVSFVAKDEVVGANVNWLLSEKDEEDIKRKENSDDQHVSDDLTSGDLNISVDGDIESQSNQESKEPFLPHLDSESQSNQESKEIFLPHLKG